MEPSMRTLIAVPCFDKVDTSFCQSLMYMQRQADDGLMFNVSSLIYDARNQLVDVARANNAEYIFWLDSDIVFEPDLLEKMYKSIGDKDFLTGLYFKRKPPYEPCIFDDAGFQKGEGREVIPIAHTYTDYPRDSVFEIQGCGFGCVLMKTEMCEKIYDQHGLSFSPVLGFGEDISFCIKARDVGYKLYCDSSIRVGHTAHSVVTQDTFDRWRTKDVREG